MTSTPEELTMRQSISLLLLLVLTPTALAATLRVPKDHGTIQAAIDAAQPGDTVEVAAGRYSERITLKPKITVRSKGDESKGKAGLSRAEATILDGGGKNGAQPGVVMAEDSTLDGFTITNVGVYDDKLWQQHFDSQGEELADDEGSVQAEGTIPAISVREVNCTVTNNIVHHNGDVGIAVTGSKGRRIMPLIVGNISYRNLGGGIGVADFAEPVVRENTCHENLRAGIGCRNSSPMILSNECYKNVRAGIGCREGARPVMRGNKCYQNRRAGIGIRMEGTAPVVEDNHCYENDMAGIGCRDGAVPVIRNNRCSKNKMAGIGCDGAKPTIVGNDCNENEMAGIGMRGAGTATIQGNKCVENKLVAIGITDGSTATIIGNQLARTGGVPPIVAVKDGSTALIENNEITGGGVAAVLVQGTATVSKNKFLGQGEKQGNAVWVWERSKVLVTSNSFSGYRAAINATKATVVITGNTVQGFTGPAIIIKDSAKAAHVFGNKAISDDANAKAVEIQGPAGIVSDNMIQSELAQQRAESMKANAKTFRLELNYHGEERKPFYRLVVSVPEVEIDRSNPFNRFVQIDEQQAARIIDYLAKDGFLNKAVDLRTRRLKPPTMPGYTMTVTTGELSLYEDLGWSLPMIERLELLATVFPDAAKKDMEFLLGRLSGFRKLWEAEKPALDGKVGREDSSIQFLTEGDSNVIDITSEFGIDKATIKRGSSEWPKTILVRLHLGGLESFKASRKGFAIEWSVASTGDHEATETLKSGMRVSVIAKDSPFYGEVRIVGGEKTIPLKDGCFEVALPAMLFEANPEEVALEWVDFYRN
jgi:hypothetical protein